MNENKSVSWYSKIIDIGLVIIIISVITIFSVTFVNYFREINTALNDIERIKEDLSVMKESIYSNGKQISKCYYLHQVEHSIMFSKYEERRNRYTD